jgi:acid stress chaperone HdeB
MIRLLCCFAMLFLGVNVTHADGKHHNIDLSSFTCADFLEGMKNGQEQEMRSLSIWLDGYLGGISGNTEVDWRELRKYHEDLVAYCRKNTSSTMLQAGRNAGM